MISEFEQRLKQAMKKEGIKTFTELAKRAEINANSISRWIERGEIPRGASRMMVANALKVSTEWLKDGIGPMEAPPHMQYTEGLPKVDTALSGTEFAKNHLVAILKRCAKDILEHNFDSPEFGLPEISIALSYVQKGSETLNLSGSQATRKGKK